MTYVECLIRRVLEGASPSQVLEGYFNLDALKVHAKALGGTYDSLKKAAIPKGPRKDQKAHSFKFSTDDAVKKFDDTVNDLGYDSELEPMTVLVYEN